MGTCECRNVVETLFQKLSWGVPEGDSCCWPLVYTHHHHHHHYCHCHHNQEHSYLGLIRWLWLKVLSDKTVDLSSVSRSHLVEGELILEHCPLTLECEYNMQLIIEKKKQKQNHSNTLFFKRGTSPLIVNSYVFLSVSLASFCQSASWYLA